MVVMSTIMSVTDIIYSQCGANDSSIVYDSANAIAPLISPENQIISSCLNEIEI